MAWSAHSGKTSKPARLDRRRHPLLGVQFLARHLNNCLSARDQLRALLKGNGVVPDSPFQGFEVFLPASAYKNRHASILLSIEAACEAIDLIQA